MNSATGVIQISSPLDYETLSVNPIPLVVGTSIVYSIEVYYDIYLCTMYMSCIVSVVDVHCIHSTLYNVHSIVYNIHSTIYIVHSTLYSEHSILYIVHSTFYIVQCT